MELVAGQSHIRNVSEYRSIGCCRADLLERVVRYPAGDSPASRTVGGRLRQLTGVAATPSVLAVGDGGTASLSG